jgi:hypothetical protein
MGKKRTTKVKRRSGGYRIALRPYGAEGGKGGHPETWEHEPHVTPLDDIVVNDVSMFRMEDMGDHFWMQCYLAPATDGDYIAFNVRRGNTAKGEPGIVVTAYDLPNVKYEEQ